MTPSLCRRFHLPALLVGLSFLVSIGTTGCSSKTGSLDDYRKFDEVRNDLTPETAQMLMIEFATSAESLIQSRIPQIVESQSDAEVIRSVQSFGDGLLEGIRISAWRLQPVGAAFDSLVFVEQVKGFLGTRQAKVALGGAFSRVEELVVDVEGILRLSVDEFLNDRGAYSEKTRVWVESNPIEGIDLVRPSPIPEVAETATRQITNAMAAVADVDFTLNSVYGRINTALAAMPQDFRHQLERAVLPGRRQRLVRGARLRRRRRAARARAAARDPAGPRRVLERGPRVRHRRREARAGPQRPRRVRRGLRGHLRRAAPALAVPPRDVALDGRAHLAREGGLTSGVHGCAAELNPVLSSGA